MATIESVIVSKTCAFKNRRSRRQFTIEGGVNWQM